MFLINSEHIMLSDKKIEGDERRFYKQKLQ